MTEGLNLQFKEDHHPNEKFFSWLKSNTALFLGQIAAIASLVLFAGSFAYYVLGFHAGENHTSVDEYLDITKQALFVLNIIFCFLFIVFAAYIIHDNKSGHHHSHLFLDLCFGISDERVLQKCGEHANKYLIDFKKCFLWYWIYLFAFYAFLASTADKPVVGGVPKEVWITFFNGFLFFLPFRMFSIITQAKNAVRDHLLKSAEQPITHYGGRWALNWQAPVIAFSALAAIYIVIYCRLPESGNIQPFIRASTAISSCINLIGLGLLITRLDSKLIGLPSWLTCVLFIYAAIQPLDIFLDEKTLESKMFLTISYVIVLVFKVYFFFIITYLLQTGRLYSYLQSSGVLSWKLNKARTLHKYPDNETGMMTSFESWIDIRKNKLQSGLFLILLAITFFFCVISEENSLPNRSQVIDIANIVACIFAAWLLHSRVIRKINKEFQLSANQPFSSALLTEMKNKVFNTAKDNRFASKEKGTLLNLPLKFYKWLMYFFILTAVLYVSLILKHHNFPEENSLSISAKVLCILFNTASALMLFYAFVQIYAPSVKNEKYIEDRLYYFGVIFLLAFTIIGIISFFNYPEKHEFASGDLMPYSSSSIHTDSVFIYKFKEEKKLTELNSRHYEEDDEFLKKHKDKYNRGWILNQIGSKSDSMQTIDTAEMYLTPLKLENDDTHDEKYIQGLILYENKEEQEVMPAGFNFQDSVKRDLFLNGYIGNHRKNNNDCVVYDRYSAEYPVFHKDAIQEYFKPLKVSDKSYIPFLIHNILCNVIADVDSSILANKLKMNCKLHITSFYRDTCIMLDNYHFYLKDNMANMAKKICFSVHGNNAKLNWDFKNDALIISYRGPFTSDTTIVLSGANLILNNKIREPLQLPSFLTLTTVRNKTTLVNIFDALSGVICAIVLCLFISRIDSKFFGLPNSVTALLFLYSAIQVFFSIFNFAESEFKTLMNFTLFAALVLKLFFVMVLLYIYQSGRIYNYLGMFYELDWRADAVFANQYEFKIYKLRDTIRDTNEYSFHIRHEDHKVMNIDHSFSSFDECSNYINKLRAEMIRSNESFFIEDKELLRQFGIHRLYKIFMKKRIFSKDFKNAEDLEHFSHEVHEHLPYCKVTIGI